MRIDFYLRAGDLYLYEERKWGLERYDTRASAYSKSSFTTTDQN